VNSILSRLLLDWYALNARQLPWRGRSDPYAIWVSEIMLQQTRVDTVIPYFERWMARFPSMEALTKAPLNDVLKVWEGLGYYSRARNLQRAAQIVVEELNGALPRDVPALMKLPGIGRYTAGAIASIAYGLDEPVLDGNIRRVMARAFNIRYPLRSDDGERKLWQLVTEHLPPGQSGAYNQALMDLGATICTPKAPDCTHCPLREMCQAYALSLQEQLPVIAPKPRIPHYTVTAAVICKAGLVLITQRPLGGLLGGLWEFPGGKALPGELLIACLQREIREELGIEITVGRSLGVYRHAYTHFRITLHAFDCEPSNGTEPRPLQVNDLRWVQPSRLSDYPMGKIDRQIAAEIVKDARILSRNGI
jgi:A/G-specific adenine glycosylase